MAGEAPPDIYLRFSEEDEEGLIDPDLVGESVDKQLPGFWADESDADLTGWFTVTTFQFSISAEQAGGGGGGAAPAAPKGGAHGGGGSAPSGGGGAATSSNVFKGVNVTVPLQMGCLKLMQACVQFAQKQQNPQGFKKFPMVELRIRRAGLSEAADVPGSGQGVFVYIYLHEVTVENYTMNSSCLQETFTLNYERLEIEYLATDPNTRQLAIDKGRGYTSANWSINAEDDSK